MQNTARARRALVEASELTPCCGSWVIPCYISRFRNAGQRLKPDDACDADKTSESKERCDGPFLALRETKRSDRRHRQDHDRNVNDDVERRVRVPDTRSVQTGAALEGCVPEVCHRLAEENGVEDSCNPVPDNNSSHGPYRDPSLAIDQEAVVLDQDGDLRESKGQVVDPNTDPERLV